MSKIVSQKLNLPLGVVILAYKSFWDNIKKNIEESNIDQINEDSEIDFPLSYSIQFLGKLHTNKDKIIKINNTIRNKRLKDENIEY